MDVRRHRSSIVWTALFAYFANGAAAQERLLLLGRPEQRNISVRDPAVLRPAPIPLSTPPRTVTNPETGTPAWHVGLDEAIAISLANSEVVRVLAGVAAANSGRTIYDAAITNTVIDQQQAAFDPNLTVNNTWRRLEDPRAFFDPLDPSRAVISTTSTNVYTIDAALTKKTATGAQLGAGFIDDNTRFRNGLFPLNPQDKYSSRLTLTQPLLQGAGIAVNRAPIVIARIETERSFFQYKASVQEMVQGVVNAYWNLVFARTDLWARRQQVEQSEFAQERALARQQAGLADVGDVSQTRVALARFKANLLAAQANVLNSEAVLRNLIGLPPGDMRELVPVTPPFKQRVSPAWGASIELASVRRPDIVELKLILDADEQRLIVARNQQLPQADAVALYRWNGLEGRMPNGENVGTNGDAFTDWTLGVNFSVPLYLRQGRAAVRRQELVIARDRANLDQGMHATVHALATNLRGQSSAYEQYLAFRELREAARVNLDQQFEEYRTGRTIFLNVLQAIADWGNSVSSEAQALADYNTALAVLERETGTILETHGIRFFEERFAALGPLGIANRLYPQSQPPTPNAPRYPEGSRPAENSFNLEDPLAPLRSKQPGVGQDDPYLKPLPPEEIPAPLTLPPALPLPPPLPR